MQLFQMCSAQVEPNANNIEQLKVILGLLEDQINIMHSLCWQDIPQFFEDNLEFWCTELLKYLTYNNAALIADEQNNDEEAGPYSSLKTSICSVINLFMEKYEEDFEKYLSKFVEAVWTMLTTTGLERRFDALVSSGMNFLTCVAKSTHHGLFGQEAILTQICEKIVLPNMSLRQDDEELFEDSPAEYIQMDIEGSDSDTRRRTACELVKGLCKNYEGQVTQAFLKYVEALLGQYKQNPVANWKSKDAAIYLVIALGVKSSTFALGATETNQGVNVLAFFSQHVLPELQEADVNNKPILKADAIKYTQTFRNQLPKEGFAVIAPLMITHLSSKEYVVRSYAASCLERMLNSKDTDATGKSTSRYTRTDIQTFLQPLLGALFTAVVQGMGSSDKWENEYVMKAITRVSGVAEADMAQYLEGVMQQLNNLLAAVCNNPRNPSFNHYLFEAVASLIKFGCQANPAMAEKFEAVVMPPFQKVLERDIEEFAPYVFQIFSLIIALRPQPLPELYSHLYQGILNAELWKRSGNVPALNTLLRTYVQKAPQVVIAGRLDPVLGIMQTLVTSKMNDHEGMHLFSVLFENIPMQQLEQYLTPCFTIFLTRLMKSRTVKFTHAMLKTFSLFICMHGTSVFIQRLEGVQAGMFQQILGSIWLTEVQKIQNFAQRKACGCALIKMLEEPSLQSNPDVWIKILGAVMKLIELPAEEPTDDGDIDFVHEEGYENSYCKLHFADQGGDLADKLPSIKDALVRAKDSLVKGMPMIQQQLPPDAQSKLNEYFQVAGIRLA